MTPTLRWAPVLAFALTACGTHQPSTLESRGGLPFPLKSCTADKLATAAQRQASATWPEQPEFKDDWVCVTRTRAKAAYDALNSDPEQLPMRDASMGELPPELVTQPTLLPPSSEEKPPADATDTDARSVSSEAEQLVHVVEYPWVRSSSRPSMGIALAGGGSKASAFGTGVLAGLADAELLDSSQYISTVSGGGYAAYFYFTHKVLPRVRWKVSAAEAPDSKQLYRDCVRLPGQRSKKDVVAKDGFLLANRSGTIETLRKVDGYEYGACETQELAPGRDAARGTKIKYQMLLRCQQDVLQPGQCSIERTETDVGISVWAATSTILTMPPSWLSTVVFDWGLVTSPAAMAYRDGIGMAFGTSATDVKAMAVMGLESLSFNVNVKCPPDKEAFARDCSAGPNNPEPKPMQFGELLEAMKIAKAEGDPLPFWIINAVATENRSLLGWWSTAGKFDTTNSDTFEMTAVSHGSGRYGFVPTSMALHKFSVLDSVGAAAAFLDPNQNALGGKYLRGPAGVAQRFFNVDWGIDISNYNVRDSRRTIHRAMPFPFFDAPISKNFVHRGQPAEDKQRIGSVYIRLIDGGNGDNLGMYSLLKRKVDIVVASDAAADPIGMFDDICEVKRRLDKLRELGASQGRPTHFFIPALRNFAKHCERIIAGEEYGYGVHHWPFEDPVLVGCVRLNGGEESADSCNGIKKDEVRVFFVKPAMNIARLRDVQNARQGMIQDCTLPGAEYVPGIVNCDSAAFVTLSWVPDDGNCQSFPQHDTMTATANSSATIFSAYRELARQYTQSAAKLIRDLRSEAAGAPAAFEAVAMRQFSRGMTSKAANDAQNPPCKKDGRFEIAPADPTQPPAQD